MTGRMAIDYGCLRRWSRSFGCVVVRNSHLRNGDGDVAARVAAADIILRRVIVVDDREGVAVFFIEIIDIAVEPRSQGSGYP